MDFVKSFLEKFDLREMLSYGWVGLVGVAIDTVAFVALRSTDLVGPVSATIISALTAAALTFPLNKKYTFKKDDNLKKRFVLYCIINLFGVVLGASMMYIGHDLLDIHEGLMKGVILVFVAGTQFLLNKFVAFK